MNFDYSNTDKSTMKTFKELLYQRKERKKKNVEIFSSDQESKSIL
jgi:hypothetical protein